MPEISRRGLLSGAGAALGIGGLIGGAAGPATAAPAASLVLHGSQLRVLGARGRAAVGSTSTVRGCLHREADGASSGEFFSSRAVLAEQRMLDQQLGFFETHLFALDDGTLTGSGTVHHDGSGTFTITGTSGAYAGRHGTYTSVQTADHSGTGHALFTFTLG
ncbi:hypothetical protein [uncultured Jatrophihabitans sp.]|uniref:hypothetical protein n=1 Tax=uncultured Jatrophihabitans sp. TaxID=1610747 RepID=UPI0035C97FEC